MKSWIVLSWIGIISVDVLAIGLFITFMPYKFFL